MLSRIEIRNFAIIQILDLDWTSGMSVITGETGAGKSIVIDALGLALGERAEQSVIYPNAKQAEVTAIFSLANNQLANQWLMEQELAEENECILRRVIVREGRSKCFINGRSVTQSQLKQLGSFLVDIHGQHAQQGLLKTQEQLNLLDRYADHSDLIDSVKQAAQNIQQINQRKKLLEKEKQNRQAKHELLSYQVNELHEANPEPNILDNLVKQHKQAATSQDRLILVESGLQGFADDEVQSSLNGLARTIQSITQLRNLDPTISNTLDVLVQAENLLADAKHELNHYRDNLDCDPKELEQLDNQLALFHDLARKHKITLEELPIHFQNLQQELNQLHADESELEAIEQDYQIAIKQYQIEANKLTKSRQKTAKKLAKLIQEKIQGLAMQAGQFSIQLSPIENTFSSKGMETSEFLVSANPGQPLQPLNKVASGGELSRISLAIAVITAEQQLIPTIIFDEVDVGIGGATAETVGQLLHQLAENRQLICVTHQAQVAACGDQHLIVSKTKQINSTVTQMKQLDQQERINEIGRMLGGIKVSDKTLSHAKEMLGI